MDSRLLGAVALGLALWSPAAAMDDASAYPWPRSAEYLSEPRILVFSATRDWRHEEAIPAGMSLLIELGRREGFSVHSTEDGRIFNADDLARFDVVVFNNVTGAPLTDDQRSAFRAWVEAGGGLLSIHGAGDDSHKAWPWYQRSVIGPLFIGHPADPQLQTARVEVLAQSHPATEGLPQSFEHKDEWYSFERKPGPGAVVLLGLAESTYKPENYIYGPVSDLRMGDQPADHPIAWARCFGEGRFVYSGLGHSAEAFGSAQHQQLLTSAIRWIGEKTDPDNEGCRAGG
ncbi:MAG: ThuA domain-containing protein [Parvularculaceae bacterium]|nr:ThuA domain-containing protein [Parvularculaceae bacterium]